MSSVTAGHADQQPLLRAVLQLRTQAESRRERSARFTLHRGDGGYHGAAGHDCAIHLHLLTVGWGGRVPGPHLAGFQVGKLEGTIVHIVKYIWEEGGGVSYFSGQ